MYFKILTLLNVGSSGGLTFVTLGLGVSSEIAVPAHDDSSAGRLVPPWERGLISSSSSAASSTSFVALLAQAMS